ncbi:ATP synthase F0 subunit 8 (mitochondrion) [Petromyzon marinus]|uniref:ATP synthase protein 8 n=2 Tax=Petromyzon marinus TaxID=7757 RepID=ATP8_PETMA|nr:ATP synthase F0 subunit 8 [Petromyzon marinus]Q35537.1 RecName: Full=ATP synthase protein 8; AltName: Full=A6L; AltName: Full=F-ATPase subunit 8 [Petromyzon marinus]AAB08742.1 ATPase 8 [Petromyzon marinus]QWE36582.1 ATP synthase F0 subunit 8 [Petromyzon marinus]
MPQLDPAPWFSMLTVSWLIIFLLIMPTILFYQPQNTISTKQVTKPKQSTWTWPWH